MTRIEDERVRWLRPDAGDTDDAEGTDNAGDAEGTAATEDTDAGVDGSVVVYWMQQSQRARSNPALEYAIGEANRRSLPLVVVFCLVADYPEASARHYRFLLEGLAEVQSQLRRRGIGFDVVNGSAAKVFGSLTDELELLVCDRGYLPLQRRWRREVLDAVTCPMVEIEGDVVVPIDAVSDSAETAARTIRPKIESELDRFVIDLDTTALDHRSIGQDGSRTPQALPYGDHHLVDLTDLDRVIEELDIATEPGPVEEWPGGTTAANRLLDRFIDEVLPDYQSRRNRYDLEPSSSQLSPYLHFGQISPVEIVRRVRASGAPADDVEAFVEELVVRRELAINFVVHRSAHDRFAGLPGWARETLTDHEADDREVILTAEELERGQTPDPIWNAIMAEIRRRGWVHNQLRMYWGKQILRWTNTPEYAFRVLLDLNNRWFLDGRDANSYANVAWCFGQHDQGFKERPVLGKVRPFTDQALRRKGDLQGWLEDHSEIDP